MKKILYISLLTCFFILAGCSSKEDGGGELADVDIISGAKNTISEDGGEITITFKTNGPWNVTVSSPTTGWCSVNTKSGESGTHSIIATVKKNTTYTERNASVEIKCGDVKAIALVTQKQNDAILLTSDKVEVDYNGGEIEIEVKANVTFSYSITSGSEWIKEIVKSKTLEQTLLYFNVDENWDENSREGEITVTNGTLTEKVKIYQQASTKRIVLTQDVYNLKADSCEICIELRSNCDYTMEVPKVDWLKEVSSKAVSTYTHYFEVLENDTYDNRSAVIKFRCEDESSVDSVVINQSPVNVIILAQDEYTIKYKGDTLNFIVNTNASLDITTDVDWINELVVDETKGIEEVPLSFVISSNPNEETRTGNIILAADGITQTVKIIQDPCKDKMSVTFSHSKKKISPPEIYGQSISGTVDWGDSSDKENYSKYLVHNYDDASTKDVCINISNATGLKFDNIESISSIDIQVTED